MAAGIAGVSHALKWLLERYRLATLGVLLGLLVGAVVGLWPFQDVRTPATGELVKGQAVEVVSPGAPAEGIPPVVRFVETGEAVSLEDLPTAVFTPTPLQVAGAVALVLAGFVVTVAVSRLGAGRHGDTGDPGGP
jgi:hypothetical protein